MPLAVLKNGVIHTLEPLPPDWKDGTELVVEEKHAFEADDKVHADQWMDEVERLAAAGTPEDDELLTKAVVAIRQMDREASRRQQES